MNKVFKSYSKKAERKHEAHGTNGVPPPAGVPLSANGSGPYATSTASPIRNGGGSHLKRTQESAYQTGSAGAESYSERSRSRGRDGRTIESQSHYYADGGKGFSESSSYETREHYERKIQKGGKKGGGLARTKLVESYTNGVAIDRGSLEDVISRLTRGIGVTNERLDHILTRLEEVETRVETYGRTAESDRTVRELSSDLNALKPPIDELFGDVDILRQNRHADTNDYQKQVVGLEQRRSTYLDRLGAPRFGGVRVQEYSTERFAGSSASRTGTFKRVEEAIQWVRERLNKLNNMQFSETLEILENMFEQHKLDNRDIQDFRQTVDECIARQAEVSAEESYDYCELLHILELEYQKLRDLSAGRMLDLDSLIAFIRAAQLELIWIHEREQIEVTRDWSEIGRLDLPMLQNYFRQLLHEIEIHEKQFNDVHNQGAALINQRHPAGDVIEVYLRTMQNQWDWLLNLSKCLESHLRDALMLKSFLEESEQIEQWMQQQSRVLENEYNRTDFSLDEGEKMLRELEEIREVIQKYHAMVISLTERCSQISPLWQRGEIITRPIKIHALCNYKSKEITIRQGDDCTLLENRDLLQWRVRGMDGVEAYVPSVVFRIPPPDPRLSTLVSRINAQFEKLRKLWDHKHRMIRYNMVLNTMRTVRSWNVDTFLAIPPEQRDEIIKALNEDVKKLLAELDPNDPLAKRLREELRLTNEHFNDLLNRAHRAPEMDYSNKFDEKVAELLRKLNDASNTLEQRVLEKVPTNLDDLERFIHLHKQFEDSLQALDVDVSNVKELYRQLPNPTAAQRTTYDHLNIRWEDLWELSRMYVERLKSLESVLQGLEEVNEIVRRHEITLASYDDLPSALDKLRAVHSNLLELSMVLQQQRHIVEDLNRNVAQLRQHVARTRINAPSHPDVDRLEEAVQEVTVRWDNIVTQVQERLRVAEELQQTMMVYRPQYDEEIQWLDRVENTINGLRRPEDLSPNELQAQLDQLVAEYAQLQEHTKTIENINKEGGKFIREAKTYDLRLGQYLDNVVIINGQEVRQHIRRAVTQSKNGAQIITEELEALNRRFAELSSVILERKNILNVLIQNWRRKQQEEEDRRKSEEEAKRRAFEEARRRALEEADRLRHEREAAEAARRAAEEADRLRRLREAEEEAERLRREAEERHRRAVEEAERRRREEEERLRRLAEEERRRREFEEMMKKEPPVRVAERVQQVHHVEETDRFDNLGEVPVVAQIVEHEDEPQMFQEETVTKTQFYEMEGILHKQTGEILTFVEAIRQGLLDLSRGGEFFDIVSGSKVSLEKAVELGYISEDITNILHGRHGIRHPETGADLTLMEAIQIGLYDPESRQLRDIKTGELLSLFEARHICDNETQRRLIKMGILKLPPMDLEHALKNGVLNPVTGEFRGKYIQEPLPLRDALSNGYIQFGSHVPIIGITLSECIESGFIDGFTGEFADRNSSEKFTLRDALERGKELIRDNSREIVNTSTNQRITLDQAILCHAINPRKGKYTDLQNRSELSFRQAHDIGLISKPMTLTEIIDKGTFDSTGHFSDRGNRYTLIEAINAGLLDPEVRHIVDESGQEVISISEALERGILTPNGQIQLEQKTIDLYDAQRQGLLTKRVHHTIFDVKGIKNTENNVNLSFNDAVKAGALVLESERVVDLRSTRSYLLSDAVREHLIDSMLQEILVSPVGIVDDVHLSLIKAVARGVIDPTKGVIIDKRSQRELLPREAYDRGIITLRGALRLAALFDVHPLLMTPSKKLQYKRIRRPGQKDTPLASDQVKVTLAEAMKQGLIDSRTQRFRQGDQEMSLDDALHRGLLDPNSEWIVPSRASGVGPTIEEKTQETVTETGQQLAPRVYPDKELQESVHTVKRVKRTETSAVGGPGGVSVYRAITGGKCSIEVPANGYHILEAERRGLIDLTKGIVSPPNTDKPLPLEDAFRLGVLNPSSISILNARTGRHIDAIEALNEKIMDKHGQIENRGRRVTLQEAIDERIARLEPEPPATLASQSKKVIQFASAPGGVTTGFRPVGTPIVEEHEHSWVFDSSAGEFKDMGTGEKISIDSAVRSGKLSSGDLRVRDALTGREMTLDEAQKWGIVNLDQSYYLDKTDNKRYSFTEAARQHRIYPTGGVPENAADALQTTVKVHTRSEVSVKEAIPSDGAPTEDYNIGRYIGSGLFDSSSGHFTHPEAGQKQMSLKELIVKGYLNPYGTRILDTKSGKELNLLDAIDEHIVDDVAGTVKDTQTGRVLDFATAVKQGLVKEDGQLESFFGERSRSHQIPSRPISEGFGSPRLIERKLQLTPYAQDPQPRSSSSRVTESYQTHSTVPAPFGGSRVAESYQTHSTVPAPLGGSTERMVDLGGGKTVKVNVIRGEDGLERGEYFDPTSNMKFTIQLHGDPYVTQTSTKVRSTSQVQSVELEPHAQFVGIDQIKDLRTGRVMSLADAQRAGIARVDKKGKQTTKSFSAFRSNIELAVNKGVVDSHGEKIGLEDAIRSRIIDIVNLKYIHPRSSEPLDLSAASNVGLLDVTLAETLPSGVVHPGTGEKISIKRAIEAGIINSRTGEVRHPFTNARLTWVDITKKVYNSITQNGVYDPQKGYAIPVLNALVDGLIETRSGGTYVNTISNERLSLDEARNRGIIDGGSYDSLTRPFLNDYKTRRMLNLIQAVDAHLIDPKARTVQVSADRIIPITKAINEGAIPREIGEYLRRVDKMTLAEAVGRGLVDVTADTYTDVDSGKQMSIADAVRAGLLSETVGLEEIDSEGINLTKAVYSDDFDPHSGRIQDKKTRLFLDFRSAVNQNVIDPDSLLHDLESSRTITLREAMREGIIDSNGRYVDKKGHVTLTLKDAVDRGLIALIGSPMQAAQAVSEALKRKDAEGYKFRFEPVSDDIAKRFSQPRIREESTIVKQRVPQRPEPGLSIRVRSSVSEDPRISRGRSSQIDSLALVDLQEEFLKKLQEAGVDVDEKGIVENPSTMQHVSIREAVQSGLIDVVGGELLNPVSGRHYSIPRAINMRLITGNPEVGQRIMQALNIPTEQLVSPGSVSLGGNTRVWERRSSTSDVWQEPQMNNRHSWSSRNIDWRGDAGELRTSPQIADIRYAHRESGEVPINESRTTTHTSPDGQTRTTSSYTHKRSFY